MPLRLTRASSEAISRNEKPNASTTMQKRYLPTPGASHRKTSLVHEMANSRSRLASSSSMSWQHSLGSMPSSEQGSSIALIVCWFVYLVYKGTGARVAANGKCAAANEPRGGAEQGCWPYAANAKGVERGRVAGRVLAVCWRWGCQHALSSEGLRGKNKGRRAGGQVEGGVHVAHGLREVVVGQEHEPRPVPAGIVSLLHQDQDQDQDQHHAFVNQCAHTCSYGKRGKWALCIVQAARWPWHTPVARARVAKGGGTHATHQSALSGSATSRTEIMVSAPRPDMMLRRVRRINAVVGSMNKPEKQYLPMPMPMPLVLVVVVVGMVVHPRWFQNEQTPGSTKAPVAGFASRPSANAAGPVPMQVRERGRRAHRAHRAHRAQRARGRPCARGWQCSTHMHGMIAAP